MVCVFFVVSGYALSVKPLRLIHARQYGDFTRTMAAFVLRRGARLFLLAAVSTLLVVVLVRVGGYE
jgi:peptidoglycan/LPS O-acetylase OafA/YrhL